MIGFNLDPLGLTKHTPKRDTPFGNKHAASDAFGKLKDRVSHNLHRLGNKGKTTSK
tara:strand:- start:184 stop:351 length:168 start_codon:yes stop_codon:yes gene_type:complete